jgi:uncharacterized protein YoxC
MGTDLVVADMETEKANVRNDISHYKASMLKSHHSILTQVKEKLVERTAQRNIALQAHAEKMTDRINLNANRIEELSLAIRALTAENQGLQIERRETTQRIEAEFTSDEATYKQMIEAEEYAIDILNGKS